VSRAQLSRLAPVVRQVCREAEIERQRVLAEQKVHLFEETVGAIAQGILIADASSAEYKIGYVNKAFEEMTGYRADELVGRGLRVLRASRNGSSFPLKDLDATLREGSPAEVEWRHLRRDGGECWLAMSLRLIRDE